VSFQFRFYEKKKRNLQVFFAIFLIFFRFLKDFVRFLGKFFAGTKKSPQKSGL